MEAYVDSAMYTVLLNDSELDRLARGDRLEEEEMIYSDPNSLVMDKTGKKISIQIDDTLVDVDGLEKMTLSFFPDQVGWAGLERVEVRISPQEHSQLCFQGKINGTKPRLSQDIVIRDYS